MELIYAIYLGVGFLAGIVVSGFFACLLLNQRDEVVQLSEQPVWTYSRTWGAPDEVDDFDEEDWLYDEDENGEPVWTWEKERKELRDRLAHALVENRRLKRKWRVDNQVAWRLNELARKVETWDGGK